MNKIKKARILAFMSTIFSLPFAMAETSATPTEKVKAADQESWDGIGLSVYDGNTFEISRDGQVHRILLSQIGAPARGQSFSKEARYALKQMVYGKKIHVIIEREDRMGRFIAHATVDKMDINAEMVKQGFAWVYRKYTEDKNLIALEDAARKSKIGLWSEEKPVAPWDYRRQQRTQRRDQQKAAEAQLSEKEKSASMPEASKAK